TLLFYLFEGLLLVIVVSVGARIMLHRFRQLIGLTRDASEDAATAQGAADHSYASDQATDHTDEWQHAADQEQAADGHYSAEPPPPPEQVQWWDVLGVSRYAEMNEITARYRELIRKYHPDRMVGLGPEIIAMAEAMTKALNAAIAEAREERANLRQAEANE